MLDSGFYNMDCMEGMKQFPDKFFDLAIVDPPYGNAINPSVNNLWGGQPTGNSAENSAGGSPTTICRTGGSWSKKYQKGGIFEHDHDIRTWDIAPDAAYFDELGRVSNNQIIWGGNYFDLPPTRCFLVWQKLTISEKFSMAMCEYAWTSFNDNAKLFACAPQGTVKEERFHPTQKPIGLLSHFIEILSNENDTVLDPFMGSGSTGVSCKKLKRKFIGIELNEKYYKLSEDNSQ